MRKKQLHLFGRKYLLCLPVAGGLQGARQRFIQAYPAGQAVQSGTLSDFGRISLRQLTLGIGTDGPCFDGGFHVLIITKLLHSMITKLVLYTL